MFLGFASSSWQLLDSNANVEEFYRLIHALMFGHRNSSIYNIIRWVAGSVGQMNQLPSVWCSETYFFSQFLAKFCAKIVSIYFFIILQFYKNKDKEFEYPKSVRNYEKKYCLEHQTLGRWFVCPNKPATQSIILKIDGFQI